MKLLTCDIGNSKIKSGLFSNSELIELNNFGSAEEFIVYAKKLNITDIAISSVVPSSVQKIKSALEDYFKIFVIYHCSSFNLKLCYDSLDTLGIGRICSCEGSLYLFRYSSGFQNYDEGTFLLTIDFG